ncbi:MAG: YicC family protein [Tissierellaceae bacterium]|nr:YicC family protein [Tissierellaceae bacterium]
MLMSMTGFGRGEFVNELFKIKVEIKGVNHRYSDINIKMPRHISYLEERVKKTVKEKISRGKIDIYINVDYINESAIDIKVDIPLAKSYKGTLEKLTNELGIEDNIRLFNILSMPEIVKIEKKELDEDTVWQYLSTALSDALNDILNMKTVEGKSMKDDMLSKLEAIEAMINEIELRSPFIVSEYKERLKERISEILDKDIELDENRLMFEIALFADKSNINEEIVRLKSHIDQFRTIVDEDDVVGRKLDFLIQEMNRETNTIGSKANDLVISKNVVTIKSEIEKIREQVQNIE